MAVGPMPTFIASNVSELATASTSMTVPLPAEVQPGDMMVVYVKNNGNNSATPPTSPSGWTYLGSTATANYYHVFWRFRVAGGDPEPTFIMPVSAKHQAHVLVYRNVGSISNFSAASPSLGTYTYTHPSVVTTFDNSVVIYSRDFSTTAASGDWGWNGAVERTDNSLTYTSGVTNVFSTASVEMPTAGTSSNVQSILQSGGVSNGSSRAASFVLNAVNGLPLPIGRQDTTGSNATFTSFTGSIPSNVEANDSLIAIVTFTCGTSGTQTPTIDTATSGSGWALLEISNNVDMGVFIYKKKYVAGDPTTFRVTMPSFVYGWNMSIYAYRNADYNNILVGTRLVSTSSASTIPVPAITTVSDDNRIIAVASAYTAGTRTFNSWTSGVTMDYAAVVSTGSLTASRRNSVSFATGLALTAGSFPSQTATLSNTSANRYGVFIAIPGVPLSSNTYNGSAFLPFFVSGF